MSMLDTIVGDVIRRVARDDPALADAMWRASARAAYAMASKRYGASPAEGSELVEVAFTRLKRHIEGVA